MQLFIVDKDPKVCAQYLDDRRLRKILVESAQMLSTALHLHAPNVAEQINAMKPYNPNHPVVKWVCKTRANWIWTAKYHLALRDEYTRRTGKIHSVAGRFSTPALRHASTFLPPGKLTTPANVARRKDLNLDFTYIQPVTEAYKQYLNARWSMDNVPAVATLPNRKRLS